MLNEYSSYTCYCSDVVYDIFVKILSWLYSMNVLRWVRIHPKQLLCSRYLTK